MKTVIAIGCAAALLAVAGPGGASSAGSTSCTAGVKTVGGATQRTFCGPAKATVKIGGKTLRFSGGKCEKLGGFYTVNIGTITLPPSKPKSMYFGFTTTKKRGGRYKVFGNVTVAWETPGTRYALGNGTVKISSSMKRGSFAGTTILASQKATGSWTC